jgi:putative endonuclease
MKNRAYLYFTTNKHNNILYIGVTNDIVRRIAEHKAKINKGFTYKYNCNKLVYYEVFHLMTDALAREKQLKNWRRDWKNKLVNDFNPDWKDLSDDIGLTNEFIEMVKVHYNCHSDESQNLMKMEIAGQARNDEGQTVDNSIDASIAFSI